MIQESEIRERLAALANGEQSIEDFAAWLSPASWNMHAESSPEAIDLASSLHLLLSEYDHNDLDDLQLREQLSSLLNNWSGSMMIQADPPAVVVWKRAPQGFAANAPVPMQVRLAA